MSDAGVSAKFVNKVNNLSPTSESKRYWVWAWLRSAPKPRPHTGFRTPLPGCSPDVGDVQPVSHGACATISNDWTGAERERENFRAPLKSVSVTTCLTLRSHSAALRCAPLHLHSLWGVETPPQRPVPFRLFHVKTPAQSQGMFVLIERMISDDRCFVFWHFSEVLCGVIGKSLLFYHNYTLSNRLWKAGTRSPPVGGAGKMPRH